MSIHNRTTDRHCLHRPVWPVLLQEQDICRRGLRSTRVDARAGSGEGRTAAESKTFSSVIGSTSHPSDGLILAATFEVQGESLAPLSRYT